MSHDETPGASFARTCNVGRLKNAMEGVADLAAKCPLEGAGLPERAGMSLDGAHAACLAVVAIHSAVRETSHVLVPDVNYARSGVH